MEARPGFVRSKAVVVGINRYDHGIPALRTAVNDARELGRMLAEEHGYDVLLLLNEDATLEELTTLFEKKLPTEIGADDRLLLYFAGHGIALDGDDGPNGYLLPQDARRGDPTTYLHMPRFHEALSALSCRHLLVILDSCFAGAFRWSAMRNMASLPAVIHQERYDRFIKDPAWQVITSSAHDQTALDALTTGAFGARGEQGEHSPFACVLFEALEGAGDVVPTGEGDGVITATELYLYLEERLQPETIAHNLRQTPRLWPLAKHDKGEYIFLVPGHELNLPPAPPLTYENNPYRGLEPYEPEHAELFFGREAVVEDLFQQVLECSLTVVLGASGTGKSSAVKAGLVPRLQHDMEHTWQVAPVIRPGPTPVQALRQATRTLKATPDDASFQAHIAAWCAAHPDERLVLIIDQFEELVTMTPTPELREAMLQALADVLEAHAAQIRMVLTLRSDFEPQFDRSVLAPHWQAGRYVVPPMTQAELREVIEQSASQRVLYFKPPEVVDRLIDEVVATPGGLPLLSFALSEMYIRYVNRRSDDRALTATDYEAVGGVVGALRSRADEEYEALDAAHQRTMRRVMLRMVAAEGGSIARRRVARSELEYADAAENERVRVVLQRLVAARLLIKGRDPEGNVYVEPAHDALVRAWDKLLGWMHEINTQPDHLRFQRDLGRAASEWQHADGQVKQSLLWDEPAYFALQRQLVRAHERKQQTWLNGYELAFARRSIQRRRRIRASLGIGALAIVLAAVGMLIFALQARDSAEEARREGDRALASALSALSINAFQDEQHILALLLGVQANRTVETAQTREALMRSLQGMPPLTVSLQPGSPYQSPLEVIHLAFSPDGSMLLAGDGDSVQVWDMDRHISMGGVLSHEELLDQQYAGARTRPPAWLYESRQEEPLDLPIGGCHVRDENAAIQAVLEKARRTNFLGEFVQRDFSDICTAVLSPDSSLLALGKEFIFLELWSVQDTALVWQNDDYIMGVRSIAFSPDGSRMATAGDGGVIRVWNIIRHTGTLPHTVVRIPGGQETYDLPQLTISPGAETMAVVSGGQAHLWDLESRSFVWTSDTTRGTVTQVAFSPDGTRLAWATISEADDAGRIIMLDVAERTVLAEPIDYGGDVEQMIFSLYGTWLLLNGRDLWDLQQNQPYWTLPTEVSYDCAVFTPEGHLLALDRYDGTRVSIWDLEQRRIIQEIPSDATYYDVTAHACSPNGRLAAFASQYTDGVRARVDVFDLMHSQPYGKAVKLPSSDMVGNIVFNHDGTLLAVATQGGKVHLWGVADNAFLGMPLRFDGYDTSMAFSPDGALFGGASLDEMGEQTVIRLWDLATERWIDQACQLVNRNLSAQEWAQYMGNRPYQRTCPNLPPHPGAEPSNTL